MIKIAVYDKQTYLRPRAFVRRSHGRRFGSNADRSNASAAPSPSYDPTIVFTDRGLNTNSLSVFRSHTFHAGPGAASGASSDSS